MIQVKNITKKYSSKAGVVEALKGIDLKFDDSGMVFIYGRSGSGKSTLLNLIGALDTPESGEIIIDGQSSENYTQSDYDAYRNRKIGFIFQEYNLLEELNVAENVALALELQGKGSSAEKIEEALLDVDLSGFGDRKINTLSGGQKQRVAIARALVKNPSIILADEPTGALDSQSGNELYALLKKISSERLVIVVSHDEHAVTEYADRIIGLKDGKVFADSETAIAHNLICNNSLPREQSETMKSIADEGKEDFHELPVEHKNEGAALQIAHDRRRKEKKKGLSLKSSFKLGLQVFFSKPLRLFFSIILSAFAFFALSMSINVATYDKAKATVRSLKGRVDYIAYIKEMYDTENEFWSNSGSYLTDSDISKIEKSVGKNFVGVVPFSEIGYSTNIKHKMDEQSSVFGCADYIGINGAVYLDEDMQIATGFKVYGHLPVTDDEIAITDYAYQLYKRAGYDSGGNFGGSHYEGEKKVINSREDLYGQKLEISFKNEPGYRIVKICGIVDTGFNHDKYKPLNEIGDDKMSIEASRLYDEFYSEMKSGWHALVILSEDLISKAPADYSFALTASPDNSRVLNKAVELSFDEQNGVRYSLSNYITRQIMFADQSLTIGKDVALYAGLALGLFAVLLLANYVSATVSDKKRTVGIIRAVGGGGGEVLKVFLIQSVLIALCVFVTTMIFSFVGAEVIAILMKNLLNLQIKLIYVDIVQAAIILGLSVAA
ncbi:MAG TPA: ATP-binding cassette domain-containing protein, partial [Clostridia bacterium]|nr:ATP-binding cassette domain-containing protein [Clostridia bacterium]